VLPNRNTDGFGPQLAYKAERVEPFLPSQVFTILGSNLDGITGVNLDTDVNVAGNSGEPPVATNLVVGPTSIAVTIAMANTDNNDFWGVLLTDADGNQYAAPSPLMIFQGE